MRPLVYILVTLVLGLAGQTPAETIDDSPEMVSLYARGKRLLREGDYLGASRTFEEIAGRFPQSQNLDLVIFNKAKADYYFGDYDRALAGFGHFIQRYPESPLYSHALYFQANVSYLKGYISRAVGDYLAAYGAATDSRLEQMAAEAIISAVTNAESISISASDFESVPANRRCQLIRQLAPLLVEKREFETARNLSSACGEEVDISYDQMSRGRQGIKVAVVLPLSGELQSFADDIYNGAVIAAELYRNETGRAITLETFDTRGEPIDAARIVQELSRLDFDAAVGPLTSEEALVASAALSCGDLPLIAPAATEAGLTMMNESSFQLSPNIELQGVDMADYAVNHLAADTAAIITSTVADDMRMARAFAERFRQLGGTVIAVEYYRARDQDFGEYIRDIKAILLGAHPDSVYYIDDAGDTLDTEGVPAHVDCLYLPGRPRQLKQLLPQLNFYNLQGEFLGSDDWGDESILRLGDNYTRSAVFPSPFLQVVGSDEYQKFATAYDQRYGRQPERLACLGYDAIRLITGAAGKSGRNRSRMIEELENTADYHGASGTITFGDNRENTALPIYRIQSGQAVLLGMGDLTEEEPADEDQ